MALGALASLPFKYINFIVDFNAILLRAVSYGRGAAWPGVAPPARRARLAHAAQRRRAAAPTPPTASQKRDLSSGKTENFEMYEPSMLAAVPSAHA